MRWLKRVKGGPTVVYSWGAEGGSGKKGEGGQWAVERRSIPQRNLTVLKIREARVAAGGLQFKNIGKNIQCKRHERKDRDAKSIIGWGTRGRRQERRNCKIKTT